MALIKAASIEAVREAADAVDIIGARVQLRRVGARWTGRCPFHDERTPSFSVSPDKKTYHCFGCKAGGDLIRFVQETEGLDFVGAVEWLADRYRIELEYEEGGRRDEGERRRRERLLSLLEDAARFYERYLWESAAGERVRAYLAERGLGEDACKEFRLGLSPGGDVLPRKAAGKGYARDELLTAGLTNRRGNDYFGARLLFPLADPRGRVHRLRSPAPPRRGPDRGEVRQHAGDGALPERRRRLRARTSPGLRSRSRTRPSSSRATRTSSPCTRPVSGPRWRRWERR